MSAELDPDDIEVGEYDGIIVVAAFVVGGILGAVSNPQDPFFGFFIVGIVIAFGTWLIGTKSGKGFLKHLNEQQQQQQSVVGKKDKGSQRTCPQCGWQNPVKNNFCHDCGGELGFDNSETDDNQPTSSELRDMYVRGDIDENELDDRIEDSLK